jgi:hypothetical protein
MSEAALEVRKEKPIYVFSIYSQNLVEEKYVDLLKWLNTVIVDLVDDYVKSKEPIRNLFFKLRLGVDYYKIIKKFIKFRITNGKDKSMLTISSMDSIINELALFPDPKEPTDHLLAEQYQKYKDNEFLRLFLESVIISSTYFNELTNVKTLFSEISKLDDENVKRLYETYCGDDKDKYKSWYLKKPVAVESLVFCSHDKNPTGVYGCFRCIDDELLQKLLLMVSNKKVKVYTVDEVDDSHRVVAMITKMMEINAEFFFNFLHAQKICFKVFFERPSFIDEYRNIKILKTIPSVMREDIRESKLVEPIREKSVEPQENFLQKYSTYYEYTHEGINGFAFVFEFTDGVTIASYNSSTRRDKVYVILNKLCKDNDKISTEQKLSPKFHDDIHEALMILASHGFCHKDTHLNNIVDCGEDSKPRYKLIDFGLMDRTRCKIGTPDGYQLFLKKLDVLDKGKGNRYQTTVNAGILAELNAETFAADAMKTAHEKVKAIDGEIKLEVVKNYFPQLRGLLRYMISNYMSNYMLKCNISGVTISYEGVEDVKYPSATFHFESVDDFVKCQKKLNIPPSVPWVLLEKSLTVKLKSEFVKQIYESDAAANHDKSSRSNIDNLQTKISLIGKFLRSRSRSDSDEYKIQLDNCFIFIVGIFKKIEIPGMSESDFAPFRISHQQQQQRAGRQTRCKSKNKTRTKSKNKTRTKSKNKTRTKSKNKTIKKILR